MNSSCLDGKDETKGNLVFLSLLKQLKEWGRPKIGLKIKCPSRSFRHFRLWLLAYICIITFKMIVKNYYRKHYYTNVHEKSKAEMTKRYLRHFILGTIVGRLRIPLSFKIIIQSVSCCSKCNICIRTFALRS